MLKKYRKELKIDVKELDEFIDSKGPSLKYYIEKSYKSNRLFKYLLYLRTKGVNLNKFFDEEIQNDDTIIKEVKTIWKKRKV
jgi:hypothetical protein